MCIQWLVVLYRVNYWDWCRHHFLKVVFLVKFTLNYIIYINPPSCNHCQVMKYSFILLGQRVCCLLVTSLLRFSKTKYEIFSLGTLTITSEGHLWCQSWFLKRHKFPMDMYYHKMVNVGRWLQNSHLLLVVLRMCLQWI